MAHRILVDIFVGIVVLAAITATGIKQTNVAPVQVNLIGASAVPEVQATIYSSTSCGPCLRYIGGTKKHHEGILDLMPPDGWVIRDSTDKDASTAHIIVNKEESKADLKTFGIEFYPTTIIRRRGREVKRFVGYRTAQELADEINDMAKQK